MKTKILFLVQAFLQNYFGVNVKFGSISDTSPQCQEAFKTLDRKTLVQMLDASSKSFDGILEINPYHLGNFDECYNIEHKTDQRETYGKYCLGTLSGDMITQIAKLSNHEDLLPLYNQFNNTPFGFRVGVCIPHKCSARDAEKVIGFLKFHEDWCYSKSKETPLPLLAWATIAIFSILIGLVVAATLCEFIQGGREKKVPKYVLPFSLISNWKSLITPTSENHPLSCLSGIKALSAMWVVLAHTCFLSVLGPLKNFTFFIEMHKNIGNMVLLNASLVVDTFFAVGGIVLVYAYLTIQKEKNFKFSILSMYIHRYIRLTPFLAIVALVQANIGHLGNGPLWNMMDTLAAKSCQEKWWVPLLYVLNWFPDNLVTCVPHSWYLSVDFQLFLFSPIILILLHRKPKVGLTVLGFLIFLGFLVPFAVSYIHELTIYPSSDLIAYEIGKKIDVLEKVEKVAYMYYTSPYTRFGPFVIGILGGYIIYNAIERKPKIHTVTVGLVWFVSIFGLLSCVFGPYKFFSFYDRLSHALLMGFLRNIWAIFVTTAIFMCAVGYGGFINDFLTQPVFQFMGKLGYTIYLIHVGVIAVRVASLKTSFITDHITIISTFCGDFTITLILSIFSSLTFEIPFVKLMNTLMLGDRASKKKTETDKTNKID